ncbi:MAG: DUF6531 domain-containing protein, partial [Acidobacteriota bacterium]
MRRPSESASFRAAARFLCTLLLLEMSSFGTVWALEPQNPLDHLEGTGLEEAVATWSDQADSVLDAWRDSWEEALAELEAEGKSSQPGFALLEQHAGPAQIASLDTESSALERAASAVPAVAPRLAAGRTPLDLTRPNDSTPPGIPGLLERGHLSGLSAAPLGMGSQAFGGFSVDGLSIGGLAVGPAGVAPPLLPTKSSNVPLLPGFNLASLPNEPPSGDPGTVFAPIAGQFTEVFAYDACDSVDPWKLYNPSDPGSSDLTAIDQTQGLWIDATSPVSLPSEGTQPAQTTQSLCTGWNLIGYPLEQARPVPAALASIEGKYSRVFGFELGDTLDQWEVYDVAVPAWANDLQQMQQGRGYWVLVTEDITLSYENESAAPVVEILSPIDLGEVTAPTDVFANIESNSLQEWTLSYAPSGEPGATFIEIGRGTAPGSGLIVGRFDPTLLLNGMYDLKLEAIDFSGQSVESTITVAVEGNMKIGHFTLSFVDLAIPLSGLDIEIVRTYDSRRRQMVGDFGHGWTLDIRQGSYRNNRPPGDGWQILATGGPLGLPCQQVVETKSHLTTVRLSDQEVYRFRMAIDDPGTIIGGCSGRAVFEYVDGPLPGTTLEILGNDEVLYQNESDQVLNIDTLEAFVPQDVKLTTRDGRIFQLDL